MKKLNFFGMMFIIFLLSSCSDIRDESGDFLFQSPQSSTLLSISSPQEIGGFEVEIRSDKNITNDDYEINTQELQQYGRVAKVLGPKIHDNIFHFGVYSYGEEPSVYKLKNIVAFRNDLDLDIVSFTVVDTQGNIIINPEVECVKK